MDLTKLLGVLTMVIELVQKLRGKTRRRKKRELNETPETPDGAK